MKVRTVRDQGDYDRPTSRRPARDRRGPPGPPALAPGGPRDGGRVPDGHRGGWDEPDDDTVADLGRW